MTPHSFIFLAIFPQQLPFLPSRCQLGTVQASSNLVLWLFPRLFNRELLCEEVQLEFCSSSCSPRSSPHFPPARSAAAVPSQPGEPGAGSALSPAGSQPHARPGSLPRELGEMLPSIRGTCSTQGWSCTELPCFFAKRNGTWNSHQSALSLHFHVHELQNEIQ